MHTNYEAYFLDLDGTVVDEPEKTNDGELGISQKNIDSLIKLSNLKPIIISTGRANSDYVLKIANLINAPYCICENGSLIVDKNNNVVKKIEIDKDTTTKLIKYMQDRNLFYTMNEGGIIYYGKNYSCDFERPWVKWHKKVPYSEMPYTEAACKFLCYGVTKEEIDLIIADLKIKLPNLSFHKVSFGYSIEITSNLASKGKGGAFVASLLGFSAKNSVHIGDTGNDINALPEIGSFIAMGNAIDEVKAHACYIAPEFRDGGISKLIKELENI